MKKLIAILVIAMVFVGAVFADAPAVNDAAQVKVNAEIKIQYPVYSLQATSWGENASGAGTNAAFGNASVATDPVTAEGFTAENMRIGDDVLNTSDVTVVFTIAQTTLSRIKGAYTLSVAATDLVITKLTKPNGSKVAAGEDDKTANYFEVSAAPAIAGETVAHTSMTNPTNGQLTITYDGMKVAKDTPLATFAYTWTHHDDRAAGDYEATVTLTITNIN